MTTDDDGLRKKSQEIFDRLSAIAASTEKPVYKKQILSSFSFHELMFCIRSHNRLIYGDGINLTAWQFQYTQDLLAIEVKNEELENRPPQYRGRAHD